MAAAGSNPYAKGEVDWAIYGFMVPHSAIRLYTEKLAAAVDGLSKMQEQGQAVPVAASEAFLEWYVEYYYFFVHHHHGVEENNFFPWIDAKLKEKGLGGIPVKVSTQHEGLMSALDGFKDQLGQLVEASKMGVAGSGKRSEILVGLSRDVRKYATNLYEHLDEEEVNVVPLIRQGITEEEMAAKEQEIVQGLGLEGAKKGLPWIMESLDFYDETPTKVSVSKFYGNLPPPLRLFMWASWNSAHATQNKGVVEALALGETPMKGAGCC